MEITIEGIGKQYKKDFWAVKDFSLKLEDGVIGLLGSNGAGKSTLMKILAAVSKPTTGRILLNGEDISLNPDKLKNILGYLPQNFGVYPNLSAVEFLEYIAAIKGIKTGIAKKRITELLEILNLHDVANKPIGDYSGGMKQRVGIAQALLNDPKLLIIDEPTVGLDPEERVRIRNLISEISGERIVIYSTHIVSDIESLADKIVIINKGKLKIYDKNENIINTVRDKVWEVVIPEEKINSMRERYLISKVTRSNDQAILKIVSDIAPSIDAKRVSPVLEDAYLYYSAKARKENINEFV